MNTHPIRSTIAVAIMGMTLATVVVADERRTWRDASGTFSVEAELVSAGDDNVTLRKADGSTVDVKLSILSADDQEYVRTASSESDADTIAKSKLTGKPDELSNDDGMPAGKKSFPRGIASQFDAKSEGRYLTAIKFHGARYGYPRAPNEDFKITLCDTEFKPLAEFEFPYSKVERGDAKWVTLNLKPTSVPKQFVICLNFNPTGTKGVYISHDAAGKSLVGLPNKRAGAFTGGDWMVRAEVDSLK
ncbi:MAG: hypothetical protein KDB00_02950 [Planctomycetales bacterium]|nr:hypothetical protein [Planctomycetales bacterium]